MKYGELNLGQIEAIVNKLGGMAGVQRFLAGNSEVVVKNLVPAGIFRLAVDYGKLLAEMIAAGRYDWKNSDITARRFPIEGKGVVEFEARYFHPDYTISSDDAIATMNAGWEPAKIEHILALGATFPDEQRKFPIVGLGSVAEVDGSRVVPCLSKDGSRRGPGLSWWGLDWDSDCRFLAVRKVSAP